MKRRCLSILTLSSLSLGLVISCSDKASLYEINLDDLNSSAKVGLSALAECKDETNCPNEVALLSMPNIEHEDKKNSAVESTGYCTGTMISENIMLTNGHCVEDIAYPEGDCTGKLWASFPKTIDYEALAVECKHVHFATHLEGTHGSFSPEEAKPDYAFIELSVAPERGIKKVVTNGFNDSQNFTFFKVNPQSDSKRQVGVIEERTCELNKQYQSDYLKAGEITAFVLNDLPILASESCEIRGGNSGSAVLVGENIHGVAFAGSDFLRNTVLTNFGSQEISHVIDAWAQKLGF